MFYTEQLDINANAPGSHAEYMIVYVNAIAFLQKEMSYEQSAPVLCAGYTIWSKLR